jgi:hypothetical protein
MRLFHQPKAGDWESVIACIAAELAHAERNQVCSFV